MSTRPARSYLTALLLTVGLAAAASLIPVLDLWRLNHFAFLGSTGLIVAAVLALAALLTAFVPLQLESIGTRKEKFLFQSGWWGIGTMAVVFVVAFVLFRMPTHFLGDGYGWIAILGHPEIVLHKWTEPLSPPAIRLLMALLGDYNTETSLLAFQFVSYTSGLVWIVSCFGIARLVAADNWGRLLALSVLTGSGVLLLFAGYAEFYPMLWMMATPFFYFALRYLDGGVSILWPVLFLALALAVHLEAAFLVPAAAVLPLLRAGRPQLLSRLSLRTGVTLMFLGIIAGAVVVAIASSTSFGTIFLPLVEGRPKAPDYAAFSPPHLLDLLNLVLLISPSFLILAALALGTGKAARLSKAALFLIVASVGSMLFLIYVYPVFGMRRDWDLMSLTVLPPVLLLLVLIRDRAVPLGPRLVMPVAILSFGLSLGYWAVYAQREPAEERTRTYLYADNIYNDMGAWIIFADYMRDKGDTAAYRDLTGEVTRRFPNELLMNQGFDALRRGDLQRAEQVSSYLVGYDPFEPNYQHLRAAALLAQGKIAECEPFFERALSGKPFQPMLMSDFAQLYMITKRYRQAERLLERAHRISPERTYITESLAVTKLELGESEAALALADTLESERHDTASASVIRLVVFEKLGDKEQARRMLQLLALHGAARPDYMQLVKRYTALLSDGSPATPAAGE